MVKILHLSDLHLCAGNYADGKLVISGLLEDLRRLKSEDMISPDLIIFSGDLVRSGGGRADFDFAEDNFIQPLLQATGLTNNDIFFCPGNHDIDREDVRANDIVESGLSGSLKTREKLNSFIEKNSAKSFDDIHLSRLANYNNFVRKYGASSLMHHGPFWRTHSVKLANGFTLGIACLNTAWRSTGEPNDVDNGKLLIGERAVLDALDSLGSENSVNIAVMHHPTEYLQEFDRNECNTLFRRHFDLILSGHLHKQVPELTFSPLGRAINNASGSLYAGRKWYNGYAIIEVNNFVSEVDFTLRRWEDDPKRFVPALNVAPTNGKYSVKLTPPEALRLFAEIQDANKYLIDELQETANAHMLAAHTNTTAPKDLSDLYIDLPIYGYSQYSTVEREDHNFSSDAVDFDAQQDQQKPIVLFGAREAGKTTFAYHAALRAARGDKRSPRIPIVLDFSVLVAGSGEMRKRIMRAARLEGSAIKVDEHLASGSFFVVVDNFDAGEARKAAMIADFAKAFPKNCLLLLSDERVGMALQARPLANFDCDHQKLYIHPLRRRAVKELTRRWLEPSGLYSTEAFQTVMNKLTSSSLPRTAYVVSMIAWTIERQGALAGVNEASLLERFVDAILNKASPAEVSRSAIDYRIRVVFLAQVAKRMFESGEYIIERNDLVGYAVDFIKSRGWNNDAIAFVGELIDSGILWTVGSQVGFRYRCVREYFVAVQMREDAAFKEVVLAEENYLHCAREIDIYSGLERNCPEIIGVLSARMKDLDFDIFFNFEPNYLPKAKFVIASADEIAGKFVDGIQEQGLTDEAIEELWESADEKDSSGQGKSDMEVSERVERQKSRVEGITRAYALTALFSKVVRNSELIDDVDLKQRAVNSAIENWARFFEWPAAAIDELIDNKDPKLSKFNEMDLNFRRFVEYFLKAIAPSALSMSVRDCLATDKLRNMFDKIINDPNSTLSEKLLASFITIDLAFTQSSGDPLKSVKSLERIVKDHGTPVVSAIAIEKLRSIYMTPNLGQKNRSHIENALGNIRASAIGMGGQSKRGVVKGLLIDSFKKRREKSDVDNED